MAELTAAAARCRAQYDAMNAEQDKARWFGRSPEHVAAIKAMQDAYVAYADAFSRKYPAEAHLLPDHFRGRQLPEYAAFIATGHRVEAMARALRDDGGR